MNNGEKQLVRIMIPQAEPGGDGLPPDQTEQVILNGRVTEIARGQVVEVTPEVFWALKSRYPHL